MNAYLQAALAADPTLYDCDHTARFVALGPHFDIDKYVAQRIAREALVAQYAWAIPDDKAIAALVAAAPLVEIGAGTGYWASLVAARGAEVVAFDIRPARNRWVHVEQPYHPIGLGGPEAAAHYPKHTLFLCWPPMTDMARRALQAYRGKRLAYVGEHHGCCADDRFFRMLESGWSAESEIKLPQWVGIEDRMTVYRRNGPSRRPSRARGRAV